MTQTGHSTSATLDKPTGLGNHAALGEPGRRHGVWTATLKLGPAPFAYDNPALVAVPLAFAVAWAVPVLGP
jgi:cation/acetate symporter